MRNAGLEEAQAGIKIAGRNINNLRYADDTTLMAESEEDLKSLLMKVKEESEKVGLKLNIQKTKIMASGPITSWEIDGERDGNPLQCSCLENPRDRGAWWAAIYGVTQSQTRLKRLSSSSSSRSEKVGLKFNIQKTKIMASGPITSWQIDGETVEAVSVFILGAFKITADGDCSHEIKRRLLLGRNVMTNLDSIFKGRDIAD